MTGHLAEFVYAVSGRDKGKCFVVLSATDNYLYLCDGKRRKVQKPKRKKIKHVRLTGEYDAFLKEKLKLAGELTNKEVRFALKGYNVAADVPRLIGGGFHSGISVGVIISH